MRTVLVPVSDFHTHLRGYQAQALPEYSNNKRQVYFSSPMNLYITVRRKGSNVELEFTADCPCTYDD